MTISAFNPKIVSLTAEEIEWIQRDDKTCKACGHLRTFHYNDRYEDNMVCLVNNCKCWDGEIRKP